MSSPLPPSSRSLPPPVLEDVVAAVGPDVVIAAAGDDVVGTEAGGDEEPVDRLEGGQPGEIVSELARMAGGIGAERSDIVHPGGRLAVIEDQGVEAAIGGRPAPAAPPFTTSSPFHRMTRVASGAESDIVVAVRDWRW